jgi:hypothetical protein
MLWLLLTIGSIRYVRAMTPKDAESAANRVELLAKVLIAVGVSALVILVLSTIGLAYADASHAEALASGNAGSAAFWGSMREWLIVWWIVGIVL